MTSLSSSIISLNCFLPPRDEAVTSLTAGDEQIPKDILKYVLSQREATTFWKQKMSIFGGLPLLTATSLGRTLATMIHSRWGSPAEILGASHGAGEAYFSCWDGINSYEALADGGHKSSSQGSEEYFFEEALVVKTSPTWRRQCFSFLLRIKCLFAHRHKLSEAKLQGQSCAF